MARRKVVVIGLLGTTLDTGRGNARWDRWRPTVALTQHEDMLIDRLELLHGRESEQLAETVVSDIAHTSPETRVVRHILQLNNPWDFEKVYAALHEFAISYPFDPDRENYLVHITTGTHVAQICLFLLTESRYFPAKLLQTAPGKKGDQHHEVGTYSMIDLDLSRYDRLASRFKKEKEFAHSFLKSGIETKNAAFNALIERIEQVAVRSKAPLLLTGPTGSGKSKLARRIFELKKARRQITGDFVEVNCATLRGDAAMSTLFGHAKGAFTGAISERRGLLCKAHLGVLFLDEIGELGRDEQAMLLRAIEEKVFYPLGSDREVTSDFQLLAGTNRDLRALISKGEFRDDLFARINLWAYRLPALHERKEDIAPNLDFELQRISTKLGVNVTMNREARDTFLSFAARWPWPGNFRDFDASVTRMATLASGGRITADVVSDEIESLHSTGTNHEGLSATSSVNEHEELLVKVLGAEHVARLDRFDRVQLADVVSVCHDARTLSEAGRALFETSRASRTSVNDADRLRKYLARFGIEFAKIK